MGAKDGLDWFDLRVSEVHFYTQTDDLHAKDDESLLTK